MSRKLLINLTADVYEKYQQLADQDGFNISFHVRELIRSLFNKLINKGVVSNEPASTTH